jgi:hypothetical protein
VRLAGAAALLLAGCAHGEYQPEGSTIPAGRWGGEQIAVDIDASGTGLITLPCAGGRFDGPVKLDIGGHFLTVGTFTQGSGAPPSEPPMPVPAIISGRLDRDGTLWLDVATRDSYPVRSARLWRGREPLIHHCP